MLTFALSKGRLADKIFNCFKEKENFTLKDAYAENTDKNDE